MTELSFTVTMTQYPTVSMIYIIQCKAWCDCDSKEKRGEGTDINNQDRKFGQTYIKRPRDLQSVSVVPVTAMSDIARRRLIFSRFCLMSVYFGWVGVHKKREDDSGLLDKKQTCPLLVPEGNVNSSILQEYVIMFYRLPHSEVTYCSNKINSNITDALRNYINGKLQLLDVLKEALSMWFRTISQ